MSKRMSEIGVRRVGFHRLNGLVCRHRPLEPTSKPKMSQPAQNEPTRGRRTYRTCRCRAPPTMTPHNRYNGSAAQHQFSHEVGLGIQLAATGCLGCLYSDSRLEHQQPATPLVARPMCVCVCEKITQPRPPSSALCALCADRVDDRPLRSLCA